MTKAYICHYGTKGMHWGVRHDRRKQSVAKRRAAQKKKAAKKKSIKERAKERIAKVDKQKVKDIAKTTAFIVGKVAAVAALGSIGYMAINELSNLYDSNSSENFKSIITTSNDPSYSKRPTNNVSEHISEIKPLINTKKITSLANKYKDHLLFGGSPNNFEITEKTFNNKDELAIWAEIKEQIDKRKL